MSNGRIISGVAILTILIGLGSLYFVSKGSGIVLGFLGISMIWVGLIVLFRKYL